MKAETNVITAYVAIPIKKAPATASALFIYLYIGRGNGLIKQFLKVF